MYSCYVRATLEFAFLNEHRLEPCFGECFDLEHIKDACITLDSGKVNGKIVVKVE
ncbi:hypothetical protein [Ruminococcus flavefaciens]|uniref:hypothetical protein n=1 Tax=Ruminococcus flavefaciens TaxID=1265 RepID=UPI000AC564C8|nr:hypothetical protein [Ruminococcus flavefaciens]